MEQLDSQEEIKVGGLRLQDIDQFVADAEEELNRNSLLKPPPNLEDTMRVNYVEGAILDGNEKKQGEKDAKEKGTNLFSYEFYENEMSLDCLDSDRGDDREALLR